MGGSGGSSMEGDSSSTRLRDCAGQMSGALAGTVDFCGQTSVVDGSTGQVTHGLIGTLGSHQFNVLFSFTHDPPSPGTYDESNLDSYQNNVDVLAYVAIFDRANPSAAVGSMTIQLAGGSGLALTGSLDTEMTPELALSDAGMGHVTLHLVFPPP
jgi:hypothetical protein